MKEYVIHNISHNFKNKMQNYIWYFYYSAYWTAYELGEKDAPHGNASYLFGFILGINLFALCQILLLFNIKLSVPYLLSICIGIPLLIVFFVFEKDKGYKKNYSSFMFLKATTHKRKRYILLLSVAILSIAFSTGIALIRMNLR